MRVSRLTVSNFQGIESAEIEPAAVTLIYGGNGSGKTSLVDALIYALTGDTGRAATLADVIRQGSKAAEVTVELDGATIARRRTKSSGEVSVNGVVVKAAEADAAIATAAGALASVLSAVLRSGRILELAPADLLALLSGLTGAGVEAGAIRAALGDQVIAAAERQRLALPVSLDGFAAACKTAEGARQAHKRTLADREADLARMPADAAAAALAQKHGDGATVHVKAQLAALRTRHEKAITSRASDAGARAARLETLRSRLAELIEMPVPPPEDAGALADLERGLADADRELMRIDGARGVATSRLSTLKATLPAKPTPGLVAADPAALRAEMSTARRLLADHDGTLERARADGARLRRQHDEAKAHGCGGACAMHCPDVSGIKADLDSAIAAYRDAEKRREPMAQRVADLDRRIVLAEEAAGRAELARLEEEIASLDAERVAVAGSRETARAELATRRPAAEARAAYLRSCEEGGRIESEISRLEAAPAPAASEDPEPLTRQIAEAEALLGALDAHGRRGLVEQARDLAAAAVEDSDRVAKALGPKGARAQLIAAACDPFLHAANAALARLHPELHVSLETDGALAFVVERGTARLSPAQLSEGEKTRLRWVLQYAAARLAGVGILVLDHAELLDEAGAAGAKKLAAVCAGEGMQVLMLSCKTPPASVPAGVSAYVMEAGRSRPIPAAEAA